MTIQTRQIEYSHGNDTLEGFLAWDDSFSEPRPGVAIAHAWAGRGDFECDKAKALAGLGYAGFAMDMYGKGVRGNSVEENSALMTPFMQDRARLQERVNLGVKVMRDQAEVDAGNTAAMGFCFGGLTVLDLARSGSDVAGVVSFHGMLTPADNLTDPKISAKVLALHGYDDPMATPQNLTDFGTEMTAAGADWQVHAYGNTKHAFTNPLANEPDMGLLYSPLAEARSWVALQNFLAEMFG